MSERPYTWNETLTQLEHEGLLAADVRPRLALPAESEVGEEEPWYVSALVGAGAWLAASLFLIALFGTSLVDSGGGLIGTGAVLVTAATALRHAASALFLRQLAFAVSLAGQLAFVGGVGSLTDDLAGACLAAIGLEALLVFAYPDAGHRAVSTVLGLFAATGLVFAWEVPNAVHAVVALTAGGAAVLWMDEARFAAGSRRALLRPVGYGLIAGLLGVLLLTLGPGVVTTVHWWASTLALTAALVYAEARILAAHGVAVTSKMGMAVVLGTSVVGALTLPAPGILAALLVLVLGFSRGRRFLVGLACAFLVLFLSFFYYDLGWTLLAKSAVLAGSGAVLLLLRSLLTRLWNTEADA